jgi:hypothetical protein
MELLPEPVSEVRAVISFPLADVSGAAALRRRGAMKPRL